LVSIEIVVQLGGKYERHFPLEGLTVIAINAMIRFGCVAGVDWEGVGRQNREEEGEGTRPGFSRYAHQFSSTVNDSQ